ncbi:MAG: hypothetical protein IPI81_15825 [Flavobacteriales bacterium]|nr:hypothetical protein [Flavobacteriales bacterium]MCC6936731.1 hypothetical protein [Flavobacteriales bacterium]
MKMPLRFLLLIMGVALLGAACNKDQAEGEDLGYGYFPRKVGAWIEYQVDSMWRDDQAGVRDSVSYRLKEKVVEAYYDPAGRLSWRIHRFILNANDEWVIRDVWTSTSDNFYAEVAEENVRRLKLSFPVRSGRKWDLNVYNSEAELEVAYREVGQAWAGPVITFPRTVLIKNTVGPNFIIKRNHEERYALDIGLVSRYWEEMESQPDTAGILRVVGWRLNMAAIAYGTE